MTVLENLSGVLKIYVITSQTEMQKNFDNFIAIIRDTYELNLYTNSVYLFLWKEHPETEGALF